MRTFFVLWEITFPLVIILCLGYIVFSMNMYNYLAIGHFRKNFINGDIFVKIEHIIMFLCYLPIYVLLIILGIYK